MVIPVLDEAPELEQALAPLLPALGGRVEVVVADGGSRDDGTALAARAGARVVACARGRAVQMNAGAHAATGEVLVFLHADCRIGPAHLEVIEQTLRDPGVVAGSFWIRLDAPGWFYRVVEALANLRTRIDRSPYGDQAMFCRREVFVHLGGVPEVEIMEDVLLGRRLRGAGRCVFLADPRVLTSVRRWRQFGRLRTWMANASTRALFEAGVGPAALRRWYRCCLEGAGRADRSPAPPAV